MLLSQKDINDYKEKGYLFFPSFLSSHEIIQLNTELSILIKEESIKVYEKNEKTIRSLHAPNLQSVVFDDLQSDPRLLEPAMQLLESEVYVHQYKVNLKAAFDGDVWKWHRDYIFWQKEDGLPKSLLTNVVVYLDEVTEYNGPLMLIPCSHNVEMKNSRVKGDINQNNNEEWLNHLSADFKYTIDNKEIKTLVDSYGIVAPKGPSGSVLFFHPELAHASAPNLSPYNRNIAIITYNSISNTPIQESKRPDFLANKNYSPLKVKIIEKGR
ncbi:hypothetical protein BVG16_07755 [Paenibacillus selenitireducens]|uniref:Phytanoyl-CoA dioxygenase n=1 Tax=Paenibacillus selenitireducens TaxID=1324314 RepID=A0A1T2XLA3_9BACL|nr:phytanoyl-CoA dioxygenase family protein [Paenibacillus selenitireducens]OPA80602.1 hypothetical protein BVG16_07755 [Paenibacillus selenitireducens]